jgi:hypothetical protein
LGSSSVSKGMASMCATLYVGASFGPVMACAFRRVVMTGV